MSDTIERPMTVIVPAGAPEEMWLAGRADGVTASEVSAIASGGKRTWRRILYDKLNGSTFRGNRHTRRGREREPFLIEWAASQPEFGAIRENTALYGHNVHTLHRATPDAIGWKSHTVGGFGVEVKSHDFGWSATRGIPRTHMDQMQWGMHVLGFDAWLYVWEVMGEDGEPTLANPSHMWVSRDAARIDRLIREADRFIAWREAGAPDIDDIPGEIDDALAAWADARARKLAAEVDEKAATAIIRKFAEEIADDHGVKAAGIRAHFTYTTTTANVLDEDAWREAEPDSYALHADAVARVAANAEAALALYSKSKISTRLNIYPAKEQS